MKVLGYFLTLLLCGSLTNAQGQTAKQPQGNDEERKKRASELPENSSTYVVSHLSNDCSPTEAIRSNQTSPDPTYAELTNQPNASILPSSFTICSMAMAPKCPTKYSSIQFFALLDENGDNFISVFLKKKKKNFRLNVRERTIHSKSEPHDLNRAAKKFELSANLSKYATKWPKNGQK